MIEVHALSDDLHIHSNMSTDDAMAIYRYHVHKLVNKYRKFKNSNRHLKRCDRDWWFPILKSTSSKKCSSFFPYSNTTQSREKKKVYSPDFATVLGLSKDEFTILITQTKGRWKKSKQAKVSIQTRIAQNIQWIMLDEDLVLEWTPDDQGRGDRDIPPWIKYKYEEK